MVEKIVLVPPVEVEGLEKIEGPIADALEKKRAEGFSGKLNIYTCAICRGHIVTRDVDDGVTPFQTDCYATPECKGPMRSSMYRVFDQSMRESHQWFRPASLDNLNPYTRNHVEKGGLILRAAIFEERDNLQKENADGE